VSVAVGQVIAFFDQKKILCAVCLEARENRCHFLTEEDREVSLSSNRVVHVSSHLLPPSLSRQEMVEKLRTIRKRQEELMDRVSVKDLWEVLHAEGRPFSLRELTDLMFNSQASSDHEMAVFRALFADRLYFKQKGELFEPRDPLTIEQMTQQMEREAQREKEMAEASRWLAEVWDHQRGSAPENSHSVIELLKSMAILGIEAPEYQRGKELLQRAGISAPDAPFELLVRLGIWDPDENLFLYHQQIPTQFPAFVLEETEEVRTRAAQGIPKHPQDIDLTYLHPLTIDSEYTRDVDDALSIEFLGSGQYRIGIHIADVATFIDPHCRIFQEAKLRATSIYLPDQRIPMIPPALSEEICSLLVGEKRRSLSILVRIDSEGKILEYQILPSFIQVDRRLSYEKADELLEEGDEELVALEKIAQMLYRQREAQGAIFIPRPERVIRVNREKEIFIQKRDRESASQKMVAEFMILANRLAALYVKERGIPAIYRGQLEPREKVAPIDRFDPLQAYRLRRILNRVEVSVQPLRHSGLGVEAYVTLTSPIRRFYDLLLESQIIRAIRGESILQKAELEETINQVGPTLSRVNWVEEQSERYWILRYLEKRIGIVTRAVVLDRWPNRYWIHINDFLLEVEMPAMAGREFIPGDQILVRVEKAHARSGTLKISPV
jgi:exoribonuclease-2